MNRISVIQPSQNRSFFLFSLFFIKHKQIYKFALLHISGFQGIAYCVWSFNLLPILYLMGWSIRRFSGAHTQLEFFSCTLQN